MAAEPPARQQYVSADSSRHETNPDAPSTARAMNLADITVTISDIAAMHNMINSLRPQSKTDETQHELMCMVLYDCPVIFEQVAFGANIYLHNHGSEYRTVVKDMFQDPFTGLVFLAVSRDRCRLSIALLEAEITGAELNSFAQFAFKPASVLHVLKSYVKCPKCVITFTETSMSLHLQRKSNNPAQVTFPFVLLDNKEDGRSFFIKVSETIAFRMEGPDFVDKLRVLDTTAASISLHTLLAGNSKTTFLTLGTTDQSYQLMDTYSVRSDVGTIWHDLRIEDTVESSPDMNAKLQSWQARYHRTFPQALVEGKVETLAVENNARYQLLDHSLFDSKMLATLINDHIKNLKDGLTLMMGRHGKASFLILGLPLHAKNVVFHVVACKVESEQ
jgi:hypothetical protein